MTNKKKAAWRRVAASKKYTNLKTNHSTRGHIKTAIVRMAVWGVIPASFAQWMIQHGGLVDA